MSKPRWPVENQGGGGHWKIGHFLRGMEGERDVETVRANELDFARDLAFCT